MQTPLTAHKVRGAWIIQDATGARIATLPVSGPDDTDTEEDAQQLVTAANAHEVLVAAVELVKEHLDEMRIGSGLGNVMNDFERVAFEYVDGVLVKALTKEDQCTGS